MSENPQQWLRIGLMEEGLASGRTRLRRLGAQYRCRGETHEHGVRPAMAKNWMEALAFFVGYSTVWPSRLHAGGLPVN